MERSQFNEEEFFRAIALSKARVLLIGRRALIALGIPVITADYDFWIHLDDCASFNEALIPFGFVPSLPPDEVKTRGRYVLENDEHIDVLAARKVPTVDGVMVAFDDLWTRRAELEAAPGILVAVPAIDDLILTKRFGADPKDAEDVRLLEILRDQGGGK